MRVCMRDYLCLSMYGVDKAVHVAFVCGILNTHLHPFCFRGILVSTFLSVHVGEIYVCVSKGLSWD